MHACSGEGSALLCIHYYRHLTVPSELEMLHMSPLGSGSHIPFSVHVAVWGPISSNPEGQLKVTVVPSTGMRSSMPTTIGTESVNNISGCPQLAMQSESILIFQYKFHACIILYTLLYLTITQYNEIRSIWPTKSSSCNTEVVFYVI